MRARIGIPPRTPFLALVRNEDSWSAWIAVRDMQVAYEDWQGTWLQLGDDGSVHRFTRYDDGHEEGMIIR